MAEYRLLVFGASGAIGGAVAAHAAARGWSVVAVSRGEPLANRSDACWEQWDPSVSDVPASLVAQGPFDGVCWAQGANMTDSLLSFDAERHLELYEANVLVVLRSAAALVRERLLREDGARLVVVSSIWQERARGDKLSYTVTKAAVGGLVRSAAVDLGPDGHLVNGVLPGVLDTSMTRANLSAGQVAAVEQRSSLGRLPDLATLADTILFLLSEQNNAITGQSITVDVGMSNVCLI